MTLRYEVVPGGGLVARYSDSVLWVGENTDPQAWEILGALLQLEPGTDPGGADTAAALVDAQQTIAQFPQTAFAALIVDGERAQGLLRGPVLVRNQTDVAPAAQHGQIAVTVPFVMSEAVYVGYHQPMTNPELVRALLDLDGGVVPGGGAWVHPLPTGRRHASSSTGSFETAAVGAPARVSTDEHEVIPALPAVEATGAWATPAAADVPSVPPEAGFAPAPDYERIDLRNVAAEGAAQPLPIADPGASAHDAQPPARSFGAVVFEDGSTFALDRDYIVGRRPEKDPRVQSGQAAALTVVDPETVLSSAHAMIGIRGSQVVLTDLGSLNGTHIALPGAQDWTRLQPYQDAVISPGTRLLFGWTIATFTGTE